MPSTLTMGQDGIVTNMMNSPGDDKPQLIVVQSEPPPSEAAGESLQVGEADGETLGETRQGHADRFNDPPAAGGGAPGSP